MALHQKSANKSIPGGLNGFASGGKHRTTALTVVEAAGSKLSTQFRVIYRGYWKR